MFGFSNLSPEEKKELEVKRKKESIEKELLELQKQKAELAKKSKELKKQYDKL